MKTVALLPFMLVVRYIRHIHSLEDAFPCLQDGACGERNLASSLTDGSVVHPGSHHFPREVRAGCWRGLLLPSCEDPDLVREAFHLQDSLQECGWKYPDPTLLRVS